MGTARAADARDESRERVRKGVPAPDRTLTIRDLAETAREAKRRKFKGSSLRSWEDALDRIILPELGHLKPIQVGHERIAKLIRDLESGNLTGNVLTGGTAERYLAPLKDIMRRALQAHAIPTNPFALLDEDDKTSDTGKERDHYEWSAKEISALIAATYKRAEEKASRYDYGPLIHVLVLLGLRVGEAQALRVKDVNLLAGELHVKHNWARSGKLEAPKTKASKRDVPLSPGLVDLLARVIPADADPEHFVFHASGNPGGRSPTGTSAAGALCRRSKTQGSPARGS